MHCSTAPGAPVIDQLLVSATPYGVRTAAIAGATVCAFNADILGDELGNIYLAAPGRRGGGLRFVSIGEDHNAFLQESRDGDDGGGGGANQIVQVTRGAWAGKAPRVSTRPALSGRYVVFSPGGDGANVARRIAAEADRARLLALARDLAGEGGGIIIRSAAAGAAEEDIRAEAAQHRRRWAEITAKREQVSAPALLARGPGMAERLMRDILAPGARILTDDREMHVRLREYADRWAPEFTTRLDLVGGALFERHDAAGALAAALTPEVALAGGGRLGIEPTRAFNVIDVDSGVRAGARDSALGAACREAAAAAAHQIRLRNLAGLIVIDFPRLGLAAAGAELVSEMRAHMKDDPVAHRVAGISESGLMEITRKRLETPILDALTEPVPGAGYGGRRPRLGALAFDIAVQARIQVQAGARTVTLFVAPELAHYLRDVDGAAGSGEHSVLQDWLGIGVTMLDEPARGRGEWAIEAA